MPDLNWNLEKWNSIESWTQFGEEWSFEWGSSVAQWFGSIYPRIHNFVSADTIVEIAPGFGRWSKFLIPHCKKYYGFDISENCIESCRKNFSQYRKAKFLKNDGKSLDKVKDNCCDFLFSFDSLIHSEIDIITAYVQETIRILSTTGVAFIHHSNWDDEVRNYSNPHNRATSVSAGVVKEIIEKNGGRVIIQEKINWGSIECIDCLTLFKKSDYSEQEPLILTNSDYMEEAKLIKNFHEQYNQVI